MPLQTSKSPLAKSLGQTGKQAFDAHKDDETSLSGAGDLPGGIEGGIAQLVDCKFGRYEKGDMKGEWFFYAAGIVQQPEVYEGIPVKGLRTQIGPEPLCSTPNRSRKGVEEHLAWVLNELRKLGINTKEIGYDDLEDVAAALKSQKPLFRFRTWKGDPTPQYPNPRTNHDWRGIVDSSFVGPEVADDVVDESSQVVDDDSTTGVEEDGLDALAVLADGGDEDAMLKIAGQAKLEGVDPEEYETWLLVVEEIRSARAANPDKAPQDKPVAADKVTSLADLGSTADEGDEFAIEKLEQAAKAQGLDPDEYETWTALAAALDSGAGQQEVVFEPKKDDVVLYKPPRARKAVECQVTVVFAGKRTCNLKSLDEGKSYKGISFDQLENG